MPLQINQQIELKILEGPSHGAFVTRVEDIGPDHSLRLALPAEGNLGAAIQPGVMVRCEYADDGVACSFHTRCLGVEMGRVPVLLLKAPEKIERIQRRDYVRLDASLPVRFTVVGAPEGFQYDAVLTLTSRTRDISGGGALLLSPLGLVPGTRIDLLVELPGSQPVHSMAEVVRMAGDDQQMSGGVWPIGVRFIGMDDRHRESIIRFIFSEQRERRRKGLM